MLHRALFAACLLSVGLAVPCFGQEAAADPLGDPALRRFGSKAVTARPEGTIRLASWNVENLFDDQDDPGLAGRYDDKNMTKPREQLDAVAAAMRAINADIVVLQEVESEAALRWFRDGWLKDMGYEHVASIDAGDERGIEQSVLSRFPIGMSMNWPDASLDATGPAGSPEAGEAMRMHRSPLLATVVVPESVTKGPVYTLTIMAVHQKSGRDFSYRREAESAKFVSLLKDIMAADPATNLILCGDFNALPIDKSVRAYTDMGLVDVFESRQPKDPEYVTHASGRIIDHIFVAPTVVPELVDESKFILGLPILPEGIDYRSAPPVPGYASDHFPLVIDLRPADAPSGAP